MSNVKLNWKFDAETKALRADGLGDSWYSVSTSPTTGWRCSRVDSHNPMTYASWLNSAIPSLEEAMALCQRDAEEQEKQRIDAHIAEQDEARQAAMRGPQATAPRSEYEAEGFKFPKLAGDPRSFAAPITQVDMEQYLARVLDLRLGKMAEEYRAIQKSGIVDAFDKAKQISDLRVRLADLETKVPPLPPSVENRLSALELKTTGLDEPDILEAKWNKRVADRLAALEERAKWSANSRPVEARLNDIGTTAAKAASRVGQLWQKQTHEMKEANKRIGKLEEKLGSGWANPEIVSLHMRLLALEGKK